MQADLDLLITLSLAAAEARFYLSLCALALAGEAGDAVPAELEMLEASMAEGVQEMALALRKATNPAAVATALREHARWVLAVVVGLHVGSAAPSTKARRCGLQVEEVGGREYL